MGLGWFGWRVVGWVFWGFWELLAVLFSVGWYNMASRLWVWVLGVWGCHLGFLGYGLPGAVADGFCYFIYVVSLALVVGWILWFARIQRLDGFV